MLIIQNLYKTFGSRVILNNVSLTVHPGEIIVLLGSSGVGKSTLLRVLNNLESYDSGAITLDSIPLNKDTDGSNNSVGMVFQQFNLFENMTVLQNITFALEKVDHLAAATAEHRARELLQRYSLLDKADLQVSQLSGGQKQRLAIARSVARKPRIICMDEPTSALDPLLTNYVAQSIQQLAGEGYHVLVATHDTSLLQNLSCKLALMEHGEIVEMAASENFKKDPAAFPKLARFIAGTVV